jgi:hypothetical protein
MTSPTARLRALFDKYAWLDISIDAMKSELGHTWFKRNGANFELGPIPDIGEPIPVGPAHIENAIDRVLAGRIRPQDLQDWANLVILADAYEVSSALSADERQQLLSVLHELATPEIFDSASHARLVELRRLIGGRSE